MKIAYVSPVDSAQSTNHFSYVTHHLYCALARQADVIPLKITAEELPWRKRAPLLVRGKLTHKRYKTALHPRVLMQLAHNAGEAAMRTGADVVLAIGEGYLVFWDSPIPASFFSDTLYGSKVDFYSPWYRHKLDPRQIRELTTFGQRAVNNAHKVFLASDFAIRRAHEEFATIVPPGKAVVTLVGANLAAPPPVVRRSPPPPLQMLWVGSDWWRKGGDDALYVLDALREAGIETKLHVVGHVPPGVVHPDMITYGFLRKTVPAEREKLIDLYCQSHLFLFPSHADMSCLTLAETAAMGLPAVTTQVGGIPELFAGDDVLLLKLECFRAEAPAAILDMLRGNRFHDLSEKARRRFETHLNWDVIATRIIRELETCLVPA